jgi:succinate dehydrogenase/fumarate reductase flavoprotein subunit
MRVVRDEARNRKADITVLEFFPAVELILNDHGHCAGAVLYNLETKAYAVVKAKAVVMATGGCGRLHMQGFVTTNHYGATADGIVMAYRAGVKLAFLHTVQFHPTGCIFPEQLEGLLITEKFRAAGGNVLNIDGEQFVYWNRQPFPARRKAPEAALCYALRRKKHGSGEDTQLLAAGSFIEFFNRRAKQR